MTASNQIQVNFNANAHNRISRSYEKQHGEIFNSVEQKRLKVDLQKAVQAIQSVAEKPYNALDMGSGTGNLTAHLLALNMQVTAADISMKMLQNILEYYGSSGKIDIIQLNGHDLSNIEDEQFDFAGTYSVLHHIPDYLKIIEEMIRVLKPGGILYIDHEAAKSYWNPNLYYQKYMSTVRGNKCRNWKKYFTFRYYYVSLRRMLNPRYKPEGDIHVFPDDHIEWDKIEQTATHCGCDVVVRKDYLLYRPECPVDEYHQLKKKCADLRLIIFRKKM